MNTHKQARKALALCVAAVIALLGVGVSADAKAGFYFPRVVRCDWGMNVQQILDSNVLSLPIELRLVGTCTGFNITQDDVVITARDDGVCPGATVQGGITADGVHRLKLRCIAVTGASDKAGVTLLGGAASLEDVSILGNSGIGLALGQNAYVEVSRGSISGNSGDGVYLKGSQASLKGADVSFNQGAGILVEYKSSLELVGGKVMDNGSAGIRATRGSLLVLDGTSLLGVTSVSNNGRAGVSVQIGSDADIAGANIEDNGQVGPGSGVFLVNASVEIDNSTISGNVTGVALRQHSFAVIGDTELVGNTNGIRLFTDSGAILDEGTSVNTVECDGKESSIEINGAMVESLDCPDPDF